MSVQQITCEQITIQHQRTNSTPQNEKDSFATKIVRDEKVTVTSFVANVGGLLGLCMGFSLVSVVEILYFGIKEKLFGIIRRIFATCTGKKRNANKENKSIGTAMTNRTNSISNSL